MYAIQLLPYPLLYSNIKIPSQRCIHLIEECSYMEYIVTPLTQHVMQQDDRKLIENSRPHTLLNLHNKSYKYQEMRILWHSDRIIASTLSTNTLWGAVWVFLCPPSRRQTNDRVSVPRPQAFWACHLSLTHGGSFHLPPCPLIFYRRLFFAHFSANTDFWPYITLVKESLLSNYPLRNTDTLLRLNCTRR